MCVQKWSNVGGERLEWGRSERRRDGSVVGEIRWSFPFDLSAMQLKPIVIIWPLDGMASNLLFINTLLMLFLFSYHWLRLAFKTNTATAYDMNVIRRNL